MAGTLRVTSIRVSTVPHPVLRVTSLKGVADTTPPKLRVTSLRAGINIENNAVLRVTEIRAIRLVDSQAPISSAGGGIQTNAAELRQLDGQEILDPSATVSERLWFQADKSDPTAPDLVLSSYTVANPTFITPVLADPCDYTLGYQVTDSNSLTSQADFMTVEVDSADMRFYTPANGLVPAGLLFCSVDGWV